MRHPKPENTPSCDRVATRVSLAQQAALAVAAEQQAGAAGQRSSRGNLREEVPRDSHLSVMPLQSVPL